MSVYLITPTRDRPHAFKCLEQWIGNQDFQDFKWIVVSSGKNPVNLTKGQIISYRPHGEKISYFQNVVEAISIAIKDPYFEYLFLIEDDDWYGRDYLSSMLEKLTSRNLDVLTYQARYLYNIRSMAWKRTSPKDGTIRLKRSKSLFVCLNRVGVGCFLRGIWHCHCLGAHSFRRVTKFADYFYGHCRLNDLFMEAEVSDSVCQIKGFRGPSVTHKHLRMIGEDDESAEKLRSIMGDSDCDFILRATGRL
jgi:hypothetical protein